MGKISEKQQKFTVESDKAILGELKGRLKKALVFIFVFSFFKIGLFLICFKFSVFIFNFLFF